jgi:hypothetical protein
MKNVSIIIRDKLWTQVDNQIYDDTGGRVVREIATTVRPGVKPLDDLINMCYDCAYNTT